MIGDRRQKPHTALNTALCVLIYATGKASFNKLAQWLNHSRSLIYREIVEAMKTPPERKMSDDIHNMECDEMWHFLGSKKIILASGRPWVIAHRDVPIFKKRDDTVKHLKNCTFFTDHWDAFSNVVPKDRHVIGKKRTVFIERHNSNTRNGLGRMTRRTTIVSKKEERGYGSIKLWAAPEMPESWLMIKRHFYLCLGENSQTFWDKWTQNPEREYIITQVSAGMEDFEGDNHEYKGPRSHNGGSEKFKDFIEKELIPYRDNSYRTSNERALSGHLLGGLFATWMMLNHPSIFKKYVILGPSLWVEKGQMIKQANKLQSSAKITAYVAVGLKEHDAHRSMVDEVTLFYSDLPKNKNFKSKL